MKGLTGVPGSTLVPTLSQYFGTRGSRVTLNTDDDDNDDKRLGELWDPFTQH